jgi:hypothetical protein
MLRSKLSAIIFEVTRGRGRWALVWAGVPGGYIILVVLQHSLLLHLES